VSGSAEAHYGLADREHGLYRTACNATGDPKTMNGVQDQIEIDVCGLDPPEPLQRTLEALSRLRPGQRLRMLIDREPRPLYGILARNGFSYETTVLPDYLYEIVIRQKS
jgi:uncharacterized protein (DUF2249 family)